MSNDLSHISFGDQLRVQALVLAPLLQVMREELGRKPADELMRKGLEPYAQQAGTAIRSLSDGPPLVSLRRLVNQLSESGEETVEIHEANEDVLNYDVTECSLAKFYGELGLADIGFHLACSLDYQMLPHIGEDIVFERTQTLMQGASRCDFRIHRARKDD